MCFVFGAILLHTQQVLNVCMIFFLISLLPGHIYYNIKPELSIYWSTYMNNCFLSKQVSNCNSRIIPFSPVLHFCETKGDVFHVD